ncbi:uncharacterized protein [Rutidosis leptorrhynchoides]|uniref:uncharacterized protein n=1 Tax=Rutidosis leptorrhynchoides TaxID=125765 RepID=UPI003A9A4005
MTMGMIKETTPPTKPSFHFSVATDSFCFICFHIGELDIPFRSSFVIKAGDGSSTKFWEDNWTGKGKLKYVFSRLFRLDPDPNVLAADRVLQAEDGAVLVADWCRSPSGRTEAVLLELSSLIASFNFNNTRDTYTWSLANNAKFTVNHLTSIIESHAFTGSPLAQETFRNSLVPKKIKLFDWRANLKRLPVRVELDRRGIDLDSIRCPICDDDLESINHVLVFCNQVMEIWNRVFSWWGFGNSSIFSTQEIVDANVPRSANKRGEKVWQAVKWVTSYLIWSNRNKVVFRGKGWNPPVALNEIQIKPFE